MKYVILKALYPHLGFDRVYPVIFPSYLTHSLMAKHAMACIREETGMNPDIQVFSAGTCCPVGESGGETEFACESGSISCNIPNEHARSLADTDILNKPEAFQGIC